MGGSLLAAVGLAVYFLRQAGWRRFLSREMDLAVVMLTLILPYTSPFGYLVLGWEKVDGLHLPSPQRRCRGWAVPALSMAPGVAVAIAWYWFSVARRDEEDVGGWASPHTGGMGWPDAFLLGHRDCLLYHLLHQSPVRDCSPVPRGQRVTGLRSMRCSGVASPGTTTDSTLLYEFLPAVDHWRRCCGSPGCCGGRWTVTPAGDLPAEQKAEAAVVPAGVERRGGSVKAARLRLLTGDACLDFVLFLGFWTVGVWKEPISYVVKRCPGC